MTIVDPIGSDSDDVLDALERMWGQRAIAPAHDRQSDGWLVFASVAALASVGCVLGAWTAGDQRPLIAAIAAALLAAFAAACHRGRHSSVKRRRPT